MIITLPIPPTVNKAYASVPGVGRVKTRAYRRWLKNADAYFLAQKRTLVRFEGQPHVIVRVPMKMHGDASNRIKLAEDYLVSRGLTGDDSKNMSVKAERCERIENGFCEIEVNAA